MSRVSRSWALVLAYALITFLSFPHAWGEGSVDLGLGLVWFGPGLLLLALRGQTPRKAALTAFLAAWLAHSMILHWIFVVTFRYGNASTAVGVIAVLALALQLAGYFLIFGAGWAWLGRRGLANPFSAAALWTVMEYLRSFLFLGGFPWATLGYAQIHNPALLAIAQVTGVYGLSFTIALVSAAGAQWLLAARESQWQALAPPASVRVALAAALLVHLAGGLSLLLETEEQGSKLRVAALQGNIEQGVKWDPAWAERTMRIYEELSRDAARQGARLILWPETAVPGSVLTDPEVKESLRALALETRAALVVGGVGIEVEQRPEGREVRYFDSAFVFDDQGRLRERYDKAHLVPFGEYIPLQGLVGRFLKAVATGISLTGITEGRGARALDLAELWQDPPPELVRLKIAVPICYELIFPDLVRRMARDGASVFLGITNDAWYGRTGAPYQFLAMTAMRSAENRRWTVRAANTGVTALIDGRGRILEQTRIFERGMVLGDVTLHPADAGMSWYARFGDVFVYACILGLLGCGIVGSRVVRGIATEQGAAAE